MWKALISAKEQASELWQQLLYALELAAAGGDDLPWLDTLNFIWDSLPDADKLTTAERRQLAHRMKLLVRENVQQHYHNQLSHKQAISSRQTRRLALAQQHLQQLADRRQRQMQQMSETARQQSLVAPLSGELAADRDYSWLLLPHAQMDAADQNHQQQQDGHHQQGQHGGHYQQQQQQGQPRQQWASWQDHQYQQRQQPSGRSLLRQPAAAAVVGHHVMIRIPEGDLDEIQAEQTFSSNSSSGGGGGGGDGQASRPAGRSARATRAGSPVSDSLAHESFEGLHAPLLRHHQGDSPFADASRQLQQRWWGADPQYNQQQHHQQQPQQQVQVACYQPPSPLPAATAGGPGKYQQQQLNSDATTSSSARAEQEQQHKQLQEQLQEHHITIASNAATDLQHSGSQLLLQRYLDAAAVSPPGSDADSPAMVHMHCAAAAAAAAAADARPSSESFNQAASQPSSEVSSTATSSVAAASTIVEQHGGSSSSSGGGAACSCRLWPAGVEEDGEYCLHGSIAALGANAAPSIGPVVLNAAGKVV